MPQFFLPLTARKEHDLLRDARRSTPAGNANSTAPPAASRTRVSPVGDDPPETGSRRPGSAPPRESGWLVGQIFQLAGPEAYHITKVLRYREGQELEFFDGRGGRYAGVLRRIRPDGSVEGELTATLENPHPGPKVRLNLYQGLLKASRWEWVLEKGTEVGVSSFIPVTTARTVVLLREEERIQSKVERWGKIVLASAKQCGRSDLPTLDSPLPLRDALKRASEAGPVLFAWEKMAGSSARSTLREALHTALGEAETRDTMTVNLFIGPEGGFHDEEVDLAEVYNATLFALGPHTLRAETAAVAASSLILYEMGAL